MPRREFPIRLGDEGDFVRVVITIEAGHVVDFVAQYETLTDEGHKGVVRHDGSHGRGHRDLLDWAGETIDKRWMREGITLGEALTDGIADLKTSWEHYREAFLRRRP